MNWGVKAISSPVLLFQFSIIYYSVAVFEKNYYTTSLPTPKEKVAGVNPQASLSATTHLPLTIYAG